MNEKNNKNDTLKVSLIVATLNELDGMKEIMPRIKREWVDQILILDGGSTDGTIEWSRANGYFVYVQKQAGLRNAYTEALPFIEGDVLLTFSPDGNSIPELIPETVNKIKEGWDMVMVSRYLDGAKSEDDDIVTGFGNWFFTTTVNILFGFKYTDAMGIYRAYKKQLVYDLGLTEDRWFEAPEKLFGTKVSWEPLLSARAARRKLKITEIPGDEPKRLHGERKLQVWRWGATFLYQFIRDFLIWR